ncbi:MAG: cupin domain-containing protein [Deltaproteobacteria bacterium]|jgi:quercetin dioxygenase-like cupin family protein
MKHYVLEDIEPKRPAEGIEMRVIPGEKMTMVFFRLAPGAVVPEHAHPHEQMGTVLEGSIELVVAGERKIIHKGEAYHILSNLPHSAKCGGSPAEIIDVFSPAREDYH